MEESIITDVNASIQCMACGSMGRILFRNLSDMQYNITGKWSLVRCFRCGLVWQHPLPRPDQVPGFYSDYHTHDDEESDSFMSGVYFRGIPVATMGYEDNVASKQERIWGRILSLIGPLRELGQGAVLWLGAEKRGKLLDVGCGAGIFLNRWMRLGWDVHGLETDPKAVSVARKSINPDNIHLGTIEETDFKGEKFDVITLVHVIEHLLDPIPTLQKCYGLLKPGGSLIISTPNTSGLGCRLLKENWRGWELPRHIYLYNPASLSRIVDKAGFQIQSVFTPSDATLLIWSFSLKIRKKIFKKKKIDPLSRIIIAIQSSFFWGLEYVLTRFGMNCGEVVHLVAVKGNKT